MLHLKTASASFHLNMIQNNQNVLVQFSFIRSMDFVVTSEEYGNRVELPYIIY